MMTSGVGDDGGGRLWTVVGDGGAVEGVVDDGRWTALGGGGRWWTVDGTGGRWWAVVDGGCDDDCPQSRVSASVGAWVRHLSGLPSRPGSW